MNQRGKPAKFAAARALLSFARGTRAAYCRDAGIAQRDLMSLVLWVLLMLLAEAKGIPGARGKRALFQEIASGRSPQGFSQYASFYFALLALSRAETGLETSNGEALPLLGRTFAELGNAKLEVADDSLSEGLLNLLEMSEEVLGNRPSEALGFAYQEMLGYSASLRSGGILLAPSDGRRRTGSHFTPTAIARVVTERTLGPLLESTKSPTSLRICDPAMGGGSFLLEAFRALCAASEKSVAPSRAMRRRIATECLYGVDRDSMACEIAKASLWLELADPDTSISDFDPHLRTGDALVGAPFPLACGKSENNRLTKEELDARIADVFKRRGDPCLPFQPFHWPIEFPNLEGFDAILENPPFLGGKRIRTVHGVAYSDWLNDLHEGCTRNVDLAAHFVRRGYALLKEGGNLGVVATNSIAQGDTRAGGLGYLVSHGATIYSAEQRAPWPGEASVIVSMVHLSKGRPQTPVTLNGNQVESVTPFLSDSAEDKEPLRLNENRDLSFIGCFLRGKGFIFCDRTKGAAPLRTMRELVAEPKNAEKIRPYLGGMELNNHPEQKPHRSVVFLGCATEDEAKGYPSLLQHLARTVKPERDKLAGSPADASHRKYWWRFANDRPELFRSIQGKKRVLAVARVTQHFAFAFVSTDWICSEQVVLFALDDYASFGILQSRIHHLWASHHASSLGDALRYTPTDCFETFPIPEGWRESPRLAEAGRALYEWRAAFLSQRGIGLTSAYNLFHDPEEKDAEVERFRDLHRAVDEAVFGLYGFVDLTVDYRFRRDGRSMRLWFSPALAQELRARLYSLNRGRSSALLRNSPRTGLPA